MTSRVLVVALVAMFFLLQIAFAQDKQAPPTRRDDVKETLHGVTVEDPYRWLEDQNSPETRAWIDQQNAYTKSKIGDLPTRQAISERLGQLLKVESTEAPIERNGRYFYRNRKADQDQYVIYMRTGLTGAPKVLVDPHPLSPDHSTSVDIVDVTEDGSMLAYNVRKGGADEEEVHFLNVDTGKEAPDQLPAARYFAVSMLPDKSGFYYDIMEEKGPRVRWHKFGTEVKQDAEIFGKAYGAEIITYSTVSEDGHYLLTHVLYGSSADKVEVWFKDLKANSELQPLIKDIDARFFASVGGDHVFVRTNWRAPNGRVLDIDLKHPLRANWMQIISEQPNSVIEDMSVAGGKIALVYLKNVTSEIKFFTPEGQPAGDVSFPAMGTAGDLRGRWLGKQVFFSYSSFHIPETIYAFDLARRAKTIFAQQKAPVNSADFELKQVWYESKDKTKVPMFILHKKGLKLDGANPTLMTAYGGFTVSRTPQFSPEAVLWAENGGVFALPNLRGGGEFGENWHKAGMLEKKQNVFDDFIGAAEWLIANKYTSNEKLAISGRSNGGLLVGAALTQRPDLFRAVVCGYPLLDMLRYQNFLVARFWVSEYGSSENADQFKYLLAYSPYQNVKQGTKYPAVLFMTGDADTRVAPLHARKMAALLQHAQGGDNPILLHYDTKAGHSEGRAVKKIIEDDTDEISFLWWQLGVTPETATASTVAKGKSKLRHPLKPQR